MGPLAPRPKPHAGVDSSSRGPPGATADDGRWEGRRLDGLVVATSPSPFVVGLIEYRFLVYLEYLCRFD